MATPDSDLQPEIFVYMIEVFKTNVPARRDASPILEQIHKMHPGYKANFDLDDCDRILRVECVDGPVEAGVIIQLLHKRGFDAAILEDVIYTFNNAITETWSSPFRYKQPPEPATSLV